MTLRIGPPPWADESQSENYYDDMAAVQSQVGAFFNDMAAVQQGVGAPYYAPQRFAPQPQYRGYQPYIPANIPRPGIPAGRIIPSIPGVPALGVKLQPLGFSAVAFTATSGTALTATTRPQKPFKGKRLVVDTARTGTTATGLLSVTSLTIGVQNQFVSTGAIGAGSFAAGAFDVNMELSACSTALDISVNYALSVAPTTTDRVDVGTTLFGETVGS